MDLTSKSDVEFNAPVMQLRCPHCKTILKKVYPKVVNGIVQNNPPDQIYDHDVEACAKSKEM